MRMGPWYFFFVAIFLSQISSAAEASPRDDMLSGISRCASITDERMFLDCAYGAAEPVRAELGLPPASPAQIRLVPPAVASATAPPPPVATSKQSGGFFATILGNGKVEIPLMPMASYSFNRGGFFTVTLKDGEVWRQVDGDERFAQWRKPASSYMVIVRSGALGSSNLQVQGEAYFYKVERER